MKRSATSGFHPVGFSQFLTRVIFFNGKLKKKTTLRKDGVRLYTKIIRDTGDCSGRKEVRSGGNANKKELNK